MKNKKLLLALGTIATVAAPVAAVVSCGSQKVNHFGILPTYTGQADQLIALGIHSDYYPEQLNTDHPFDYLTDPGKYMTQQNDDFKGKFKSALDGLMPKTKGVSWWNQDAKASDDHRISNTYWQKQEGSVLMYEHYLLDDDQKVIESAWAPKHQPQVTIQTNFRASRDPYSRIPKGVFFGWDLSNKTLEEVAKGSGTIATADITLQPAGQDNKKVYDATATSTTPLTSGEFTGGSNGITVNLKHRAKDADSSAPATVVTGTATVDVTSAKIIIAMRKKRAEFLSNTGDDKGKSTWFYNDWYFVDSFHRTYLDNDDFQNSNFVKWMVDSSEAAQNPFVQTVTKTNAPKEDNDIQKQRDDIGKLFAASTFTADEIANGVSPTSAVAAATSAVSPHHPIYEQQEGSIGAAPMFEGAMRDNQLYLFNVAWQTSNMAKYGTAYGKSFYDSLPQATPAGSPADFSVPRSKDEADKIRDYVAKSVSAAQLTEMKDALKNADTITGQLKARMAKIKTYLANIGAAGKTFGLLTIAPGHGVSTLQTMSKYSFIYQELGLAQPIPSNLHALAASADKFTKAWQVTGSSTSNKYMNGDTMKTSMTPSDAEFAGIKEAVGPGSIFNMDDNGWFWTLGNAGQLDSDKLAKFQGSIDFGVVAAQDTNFEAEVTNNAGIQEQIAEMFKGYSGATADKAKLNAYNAAVKAYQEQIEEVLGAQDTRDDTDKTAADVTAAKKTLSDNVTGDIEQDTLGNYDSSKFKGDLKTKYEAVQTAKAAVPASSADATKFVGKLREAADYNLWNEGLKTPFVMDMLLDQIMTKAEEWSAQTEGGTASFKGLEGDALQAAINTVQAKAGHDDAADWGDYFTKTFVK